MEIILQQSEGNIMHTIFTVEGNGEFPLDMLRYDEAYPLRQEDARKITDSIKGELRKWKINLGTESSKDVAVQRWNSFLIKVTNIGQ